MPDPQFTHKVTVRIERSDGVTAELVYFQVEQFNTAHESEYDRPAISPNVADVVERSKLVAKRFAITGRAVRADDDQIIMRWQLLPTPAEVQAGRAAALEDLEHALTFALVAMATNAAADLDDPDWRRTAIEQFRRDLQALGVTPAEMDTAGIMVPAGTEEATDGA